MANPYHDSEGKFCSKGEMMQNIDDLARKGKTEEYLKLKKEFDKIESKPKNLASFFGVKSQAEKDAIKLKNDIHDPIMYHYFDTSQVLEEKIKDVVSKPVDPDNKHARFNETRQALVDHFTVNKPIYIEYGVGETFKVATMIFIALGRRDEINWSQVS